MGAQDNREIEVKLGLLEPCPQLHAQLLEIGKVSAMRSDELQNIYFDTKERDLFDLKAGVRIRRGRKLNEQTLKLKGSTLAGVHSRSEYNVDISPEAVVPDLSKFPPEAFPAGTDVAALQQKLEKQCQINFRRECYDLEYKNCIFEIAVDAGSIIAGSVQAPLLELEIEVKQAALDSAELIPLFDELVFKLAKCGVKLTLEPFSKMHRAALLMGVRERNSLQLPDNPSGDIGSYIAVSLKTFESLLGLYLVKRNPLYLGYMAYTLKNLRRAYDGLVERYADDENVNFSQSFKALKQSRKLMRRSLKRLAKYMREQESRLLRAQFSGKEIDGQRAVQQLRAQIAKTQAFCLPLHLRALLLSLESVQRVNQQA